jgi:DNA polymerase III alpha subunit
LTTCEEVAVDSVYGFQEEPMKFVSFEDTTGLYETVFFPKVYNQFCHMLNERRPYILKGKVEEDFGSITMTVSWIGFLDRYKQDRNGRAMQKA